MSERICFSVTKKDFDISYFSGTGAGGQHRNKHMNCVRLKHKDTGIVYIGQRHRERLRNLNEAFTKLTKDKRFLAYCSMKLRELEGKKSVEQLVDELMAEDNLKIEYKVDGKWMEEGKINE